MTQAKSIPGINIQWPWSQQIASGSKTVETRSYPIPEKYKNKELAVIETPGPRGRKEAGIDKARIIGTIVFSDSFRYPNKRKWQEDFVRHCVSDDDPLFGFDPNKAKWGWVVAKYRPLKYPVAAPCKRGIVFALACQITAT